MGVVLFLFTIGIPESYAQQLKISGIVKDAETNNPLLGASVVIRGTRTGVATNLQGEFSILTHPGGRIGDLVRGNENTNHTGEKQPVSRYPPGTGLPQRR